MPYRVEISPNNRATCKNKECKDDGVKILKGEVRFGTWVSTPNFESWSYKHWGCVTPAQIANLVNDTDGDVTNVDGYEDLPDDAQAKVRRALEQGHVDDEDWKGDIERNRPGMKGMRTPQSVKKKMEVEAEEDDEAEVPESPSKGKGKKRTKKQVDEEDEAPKEKKGRAKKVKKEVAEDEGQPEAPPAKKQRGKAKKVKEEADADADAEAPAKPKGKGKGKKAAKAEPAVDEMDAEPTSIFGPREENGTADTPAKEVGVKPKKGGRSKKKADNVAEAAGEEPAKPKGRGGRKKKVSEAE